MFELLSIEQTRSKTALLTMADSNLNTFVDVLIFVPNLIGYSRIMFTFTSFILMIFSPDKWIFGVVLYLASFVGDLFDGMAARALNQCSTFGGLLDMVTDRCATLGLLFILYGIYGAENHEHNNWFRMLFLSLALLDISSHWCQMYSTAALQVHHKSDEGNVNRFFLVRWYYQNVLFFGYCCVGAELTYIILYIIAHNDSNNYYLWLSMTLASNFLYVCVPGCMIKQIVNVFQLTSACKLVASYDAEQKNKTLKI